MESSSEYASPKEISAIPRFFSPRGYPPHRIAFAIMLATGLLLLGDRFFLQDLSTGEALTAGANVFFASFVTWAIARELDPDRVSRAYLVQILLIPFSLIYGPMAILPSTIALASSRYLTRISGLNWTIWDRLLLFFAPLGFMLYYQNPAFGFVGSLIFAADACMDKKTPYNKIFLTASALLSTIYTFFYWNLSPPRVVLPSLIVLIFVVLLSIFRVTRLKSVSSLSDYNERSIQPERLRIAVLIALLLPLISIGLVGVSPDQFALVIIALLASAV